MAVSAEVSRVTVEKELERAASYAERRGWYLEWDAPTLILRASIAAPDKEQYLFEFHFDDYPEIPPLIDVIHPKSGDRNHASCFPTGGKGYFHPNNLICAHWSRRAYGVLGGPHGNWAIGDWRKNDLMRSELGMILALITDLLDDPSYTGRRGG